MKTVFRPLRMLWLGPIMLFSTGIDDPNIAIMFTFALAAVTSRLFPIIETIKDTK